MDLINSEIVSVRNVIEVSEDGLLGLSDKPAGAFGMTLASGPYLTSGQSAPVLIKFIEDGKIIIDSSDTEKVKLMLDDVAGVTGFATDTAADIGDIVVKHQTFQPY